MFTATELIDELNLDDTPETEQLFKGLIDDNVALIMDTLGPNVSLETVQNDLMFQRCIKNMVTEMYYDRTLKQGFSSGTQILMNHLIFKYSLKGSASGGQESK